jgi:hypothetical protein
MDIQAQPTPDEIWRAFRLIGAIATGRHLVAISVGTTSTTIKHYLGRVPVGWIQVSPKAGITVITQSSSPDITNLYLQTATAATSIDVWVW